MVAVVSSTEFACKLFDHEFVPHYSIIYPILVAGEGESNSNLSIPCDSKHHRWPSFSNAFPSFISTGSNSQPPSTISLCQQWNNVINNWDQYSKKKSFVAVSLISFKYDQQK